MKDFVKKHTDDAEGYLLLAMLHRRKSEPDEAHEFFVRGFEKVPTQVPAHLSWAYSDFGKMLLQEGKFQDALTYQLKAVEMSPNDDDALMTLGLIYFQLNKDEELKAVREKLTQMSSPLLPAFEEQTVKKK
jgi:tetratricopeptide (TPR) repeat protein